MTLAINEPRQMIHAGEHLAMSNPVAAMLETIIQKGITADSAAAMEKLTDLYLKVEAENARKSFAVAKAQLQAELPRVIASRIIPNNDGSARSTFAAYEDIMKAIQPMLVKHGFSISFTFRYDTGGKAERLCAICRLSHTDGHSETNEFAVRVSAPPKASDAQGDGATHTYAKRYALCAALNITIDKDNDARVEGEYITAEEARDLEFRVKSSGANVEQFLKFAHAESFETIRAERLQSLHDAVTAKQRKAADSKTPPADPAAATWGSFALEAEDIAKAKGIDVELFDKALAKLKLSDLSRPSNTKGREEWLGKLAKGAKLKADGTFE